jgi:uncharacterized protein YkwD
MELFHMKCLVRYSLIVGLLFLLTACGPSEAEIEQMVATGVAEALAGTAAAQGDSEQAEASESEEAATSDQETDQESEPEAEAPTATPESEPPTPTPTEAPIPTLEVPDVPNPETLELIAKLNAWRLDEGLWPLSVNETLMEMAQAQAEYLSTLDTITNFHVDAEGNDPFARAVALGWPHYKKEDQVSIGENAQIGANVDEAIAYWSGSEIHRKAATNPGYREVGASAFPHPLGFIYIVVFGSRPGVLPTLVDPVGEKVYLTSEQYTWAAGGDWILDVTQYQVLESEDDEIDESAWVDWEPSIDLPFDSTDPFYIAYTDGEQELIVEVRPLVDIAWLPDNLPEGD